MPTKAPPDGYVEVAADEVRELMASNGSVHVRVMVDRSRGLQLIATVDAPDGHGPWRHLSIAHKQRYPTWNEIREVRDWWFPADMEAVIVLPRAEEYVNDYETAFHVWESACGKEGIR